MPRIKIVPNETLSLASSLDSKASQLSSISSSASSAVTSLSYSIRSKAGIESKMGQARSLASKISGQISSMSGYVKTATNMLVEADKSGARGLTKKYEKYNINITGIQQSVYKERMIGKTPVIKNPGDYYFDGEDGSGINRVYYLLDDKGAGIPNPYYKKKEGPLGLRIPNFISNYKNIMPQGHAAIILEKSDGGAIYYSWGSNQNSEQSQIILGQNSPGILNRRDLSPNDFIQFKQNGRLPIYGGEAISEEPSYTRFLSVSVSEQNGKAMFAAAQDIFNGKGDYDRSNYHYNLYGNNCHQNVQKILGAASLNFTPLSPTSTSVGAAYGAVQFFDDNIITAPVTEIVTDKLGVIPKESYKAGYNQWSKINSFEVGKFKK